MRYSRSHIEAAYSQPDVMRAAYGYPESGREPLEVTINDAVHTFTPMEGGFHVKDLPDGKCVDVLKMIFNWRVVRSSERDDAGEHMYMDRGWCYQGTGPVTLFTALMEAVLWDGADDTEPGGDWIKRAL